jgi:hypothetical protein
MRLILASLALTACACSAGGTYRPPGDLSTKTPDLAGDMVGACGVIGEPCCAGSVCSSGSCVNGVCTTTTGCGHIGMVCCLQGTPCTDASSVCMNNTCVPTGNCGASGEPCCNGACTDGTSVCQNGTCVTPQCGHLGQQCCNGVSCTDPGSQCQGGICSPCGSIGQQCCNGITCTQGVCQAGTCGQAATYGVGHTCTSSTMCTGTSPMCYTMFPGTQLNFPAGYCSNSNCASDASCGTGGFCDTMFTKACFQSCANPGDCTANNASNACFFFPDGTHAACWPKMFSNCDPTVGNSCVGQFAGQACLRSGIDNVGSCNPTCTFGGAACPNDPNGNAQGCYYYNATLDVNGNPTGDTWNGLTCLSLGAVAANAACMFINDCVSGYECDVFTSKLCKQQCQLGTTACTTGTCQNAFKLTSFVNGSIGLCL